MSPVPEIRFLAIDGRRLAYELTGEGPLLLSPAWWVSHLELDRRNQAFARFWEAIVDGYALVRYDRLGVGVSDRELRDKVLGEVSSQEQERFARFQRLAASADTAARLLEQVYRNDVRDHLPRVQAPTLVVHRREDRAIPYRLGREVAAGIAGATLVPLEGSAHFPWAGDADSVVRALRPVLTADSRPERPAEEEPAAALLSRREREVLKLVAQGLNDREIAEQLIVSPHTVHRHVANIRHKLGRGSRTAAVAEAARLGLL